MSELRIVIVSDPPLPSCLSVQMPRQVLPSISCKIKDCLLFLDDIEVHFGESFTATFGFKDLEQF